MYFSGEKGKSRAEDFFGFLQRMTEAALTRRKRRKRLKREKQAKKNIIVDWIEAFLWAAGVVLIINQYLIQAYQIPSGSMIDTLLIRDRIFVNKIVYGPELLPGLAKIKSPIEPKRNDIIIFESPSYISRGTAFDVAQRIIYMLTLSWVDIDKDELGRQQAHFLIKRAIGMGGDRIFNKDGEMQFQFAGEERLISERDYNKQRGWQHSVRRLATEENYKALKIAAAKAVWDSLTLTTPLYLTGEGEDLDLPLRVEEYSFDTARLAVQRAAYPHIASFRSLYYKSLGWYVPPGRVMPLGDNRDNSLDGRSFGPVRETKILGRALMIYWPGMGTEDGSAYSPRLDPPPKEQGWSRFGAIR